MRYTLIRLSKDHTQCTQMSTRTLAKNDHTLKSRGVTCNRLACAPGGAWYKRKKKNGSTSTPGKQTNQKKEITRDQAKQLARVELINVTQMY